MARARGLSIPGIKALGADGVATDSARLLRIPGTINSRNGAICKPILITDKVYSMYDLREKYLSWKPTRIKPQRKTGGGKVTHLFNPYTLHKARLSDLLTLCRLRNYDVRGCRNTILHLYAYWQGITMRDTDELATAVHELNDSFKKPLKPTEVVAVVDHPRPSKPSRARRGLDQAMIPKRGLGL